MFLLICRHFVCKAANIGWIKLFPKMLAVVSCQLASGVIETGDLVRVDGTSGVVEVVEAFREG